MTHNVRRHTRITKGKRVNVRAHNRDGGSTPRPRPSVQQDDEARYLDRADYVEEHPDVTGLLADEAYDRDAAAANDAAQRMIAEQQDDYEQWENYQ